MSKIQEKISQLSGLITAFGTELKLNNELKKGEKFLLIQELQQSMKMIEKLQDELKKEFLEIATTEVKNLEGAEVFYKIAYPKPTLDVVKLENALIQAYAEINAEYKQESFLKESTPRKTLIVQSIIK